MERKGNIAEMIQKGIYGPSEWAVQKLDFYCKWRRTQDSNLRTRKGPMVFKTIAFDHSANPPLLREIDKMVVLLFLKDKKFLFYCKKFILHSWSVKIVQCLDRVKK